MEINKSWNVRTTDLIWERILWSLVQAPFPHFDDAFQCNVSLKKVLVLSTFASHILGLIYYLFESAV